MIRRTYRMSTPTPSPKSASSYHETRKTPRSEGFFQPAEWEAHQACWLAWPSHGHLWKENLENAQLEFTALCRTIGESEHLEILVPDAAAKASAEKALS